MRTFIVWTIRPLLLLIPLTTAYLRCPPLRLVVDGAAGLSPGCSVGEALNTYRENRREYERVASSIAALCSTVRTDGDGYVLWRSPDGEYWMPGSYAGLLPHLLSEQRRHVYGAGRNGVQPGDVVLDCGAHVGVFARTALAAGARLVVAIEPAPRNLECLRRNFAAEISQGRVIVYPKGVWDAEATLDLAVSEINSAGDTLVLASEGSSSVRVPLTTVDLLVQELGLPRVDFMKLDIEGAERRALAGAQDTLRKHRPRLAVAAYHLADDPEAIPREITRAGAGYAKECGYYGIAHWRVIPEVLYFRVTERRGIVAGLGGSN